jgi:hypothetical protein
MPLAEERLAEKVPFDVYAVMLVLTALLTLGAILMLNADLRENWYGSEPPGTKHAENVTQLNAQTDEEKTTHGTSPWTQVTDTDRADYECLGAGAQLKTPAYPEWLKVNTEGVKFLDQIANPGEYPVDQVPQEVRDEMKNSYVEIDPTSNVLEEKTE